MSVEIPALALIALLMVALLKRHRRSKRLDHLQDKITLLRWQIRNRSERLKVTA